MRLKSPIYYIGGKSRLVSKLLKYIPQHTYYLEVFGGGASLLFAKQPSDFEVYNDIENDVVNFFRVLRDAEKFEKFYKKVCLTPYSRKEFYFCQDTYIKCEDDVERAYRWFIFNRQSFGGKGGSSNDKSPGWGFVITGIANKMSRVCNVNIKILELLPYIHKRLMRVQIEHLDWKKCLEYYIPHWNYRNSFIYLDPPYVNYTRNDKNLKYKNEFTIEQHKELINFLIKNQNNNKFMLSGYDSEIYFILEEKGWKKICWDVTCNVAGRTQLTGLKGKGQIIKYQKRNECIWMNYDINGEYKIF